MAYNIVLSSSSLCSFAASTGSREMQDIPYSFQISRSLSNAYRQNNKQGELIYMESFS